MEVYHAINQNFQPSQKIRAGTLSVHCSFSIKLDIPPNSQYVKHWSLYGPQNTYIFVLNPDFLIKQMAKKQKKSKTKVSMKIQYLLI